MRAICKDSSGNLHVVWEYNSTSIYYAKSLDGITWNVNKTFFTGDYSLGGAVGDGRYYPDISCQGDNITIDYANINMDDYIVAYSTDNGNSFTFINPVTSGEYYYMVNERRGSNIYLVFLNSTYDLEFINSTDGGATWGKKVTIGMAGATQYPSIAVNGTGSSSDKIYIAYGNRSDYDIYYINSTDSGKSWGKPLPIQIGTFSPSYASITYSGTNIYIASATGSGPMYYNVSTNEGITWTGTILQATNARNPIITINTNNQPIILYEDNTNNAKYDLAYYNYNGASWDSTVFLTNNNYGNRYPNIPVENYADEKVHYVWLNGSTAGHYQILYDRLPPGTSPRWNTNTNSTNTTLAGEQTLFSLYWTDDAQLSGSILQLCNGTWNGVNCSGVVYGSPVTIILNESNSANLGDSWVNEAWPNTNYGTEIYINVQGKLTLNTRGFILWKLSSIPANSIITNANLSLYLHHGVTIDRTFNIYNTSEEWAESGITWNNQPSADTLQDSTIIYNGEELVWKYVNITNAVITSFKNNKNVSILIKSDDETYNGVEVVEASFVSKNYGNSSLSPQLVITYIPFSAYMGDNSTWQPMSGIGNWSNHTAKVNSTVGANMGWRIYANDTENTWNTSEVFSYVTTSGEVLQEYSSNIIDLIQSTDSTSRLISIEHSLSDIQQSIDTNVPIGNLLRELSDFLQSNQVIINMKVFFNSLSESMQSQDITINIKELILSLSELPQSSDGTVSLKELLITLSESEQMSDKSISLKELLKILADSLQPTDANMEMKNLLLKLSESLQAQDIIINWKEFLKMLSYSIRPEDARINLKELIEMLTIYSQAQGEQASLSELLKHILNVTQTGDVTVDLKELMRLLSESGQVEEKKIMMRVIQIIISSLSQILDAIKSAYESLALEEFMSSLVDSISSVFISMSNRELFREVISEAQSIDATTDFRELIRFLSETQQMQDTNMELKELMRMLSELPQSSDETVSLKELLKVLSESDWVQDSRINIKELLNTLIESVQPTDANIELKELLKQLSEEEQLSDVYINLKELLDILSESIEGEDVRVNLKELLRILTEYSQNQGERIPLPELLRMIISSTQSRDVPISLSEFLRMVSESAEGTTTNITLRSIQKEIYESLTAHIIRTTLKELSKVLSSISNAIGIRTKSIEISTDLNESIIIHTSITIYRGLSRVIHSILETISNMFSSSETTTTTTTTRRGGIRYPEEITTSTTTIPKLPIMLEKYKAIDEQLASIIIVATAVTLFINRKKIEDHFKKKRKERKLKERKDRDSNLTPSIKLRKVINSNRVSIKHLSNNIKLKLKKRGYR